MINGSEQKCDECGQVYVDEWHKCPEQWIHARYALYLESKRIERIEPLTYDEFVAELLS